MQNISFTSVFEDAKAFNIFGSLKNYTTTTAAELSWAFLMVEIATEEHKFTL